MLVAMGATTLRERHAAVALMLTMGTVCVTFLLLLANFGVLIWGSVVVFGDNRYSKYKDNTLDCQATDLFYVGYVILIIQWVGVGLQCCNQNRNRNRNRDDS